MGLLTILANKARETIADAAASVLGPTPLRLTLISGGAAETIYQAHAGGLRVLVLQDYEGSPWSWMAEDAHGKMVAMRGTCSSYVAAVANVSQWLASDEGRACQGGIDGPPRAA